MELVDAARRADSPEQALRVALRAIGDHLGARFALLLEESARHDYRCVIAEPDGRPDIASLSSTAVPADGFLIRRLRVRGAPLPWTSDDIETWHRWAREYKPHYLPELDVLRTTEARMAVAVRTKHQILAVLVLGGPAGRDTFTSGERDLLRYCAAQFAQLIENARLTARVVEQEKLRRDVALAAEIQHRLLPEHPPTTTAIELAAVSVPARGVGGDYYDFLVPDPPRFAIALADVAGKGVAAALIMSAVHAWLRVLCAEPVASVPALAATLNGLLHRSTQANSYATCFYAEVDERQRLLRYVNAGHPPPLLLRACGCTPASASAAAVETLSIGGTVLGLLPESTYEEGRVELGAGDVLLAYTDGVSEAMNRGGEEFGEARIAALVREVAGRSADEIAAHVWTGIQQWMDGAPQHDDITFIVMKVGALTP